MNQTIKVQGMHCKSCEMLIKDRIESLPNCKVTSISHNKGVCCVSCDITQLAEINQIIANEGYGTWDEASTQASWSWITKIARLVVAAILIAVLMKINVNGLVPDYKNISFSIAFVIGLIASVSTCLAITGWIIIWYSESVHTTHPRRTQIKFHVGRLIAFIVWGWLLWLIGGTLWWSIRFNIVFSVVVGIVLTYLGLQILGILPNITKLWFHLPSWLSQTIFRLKDPKYASIVGALTFLLPCGFTQSMQLLALQSGSMWQWMLIMAAFALGTLPVLFGLGMGTKYIKDKITFINPLIASLLVVFGCYTIYNATVLAQSLTATTSQAISEQVQDMPLETVQVWHDGVAFVPDTIRLKTGKNYKLVVTPESDGKGCNSQVMIPGKWAQTIKKWIPFEIMVDGSSPRRIKLVCASMGMRQWDIIVE